MKKSMPQQIFLLITFFTAFLFSSSTLAIENTKSSPVVISQIIEKAKTNDNWKIAFATATHGQVVFMNVSPTTNPKNEIGMETHSFDQVILVVEGNGKAELAGKTSMVNSGDMIFIPQGTAHNVINLNQNKPLKIISFYSSNDIPANSVYKKKAEEPQG